MIANHPNLVDDNIFPLRTSPLYSLELQLATSRSLKRAHSVSRANPTPANSSGASSALSRSLSTGCTPRTRPTVNSRQSDNSHANSAHHSSKAPDASSSHLTKSPLSSSSSSTRQSCPHNQSSQSNQLRAKLSRSLSTIRSPRVSSTTPKAKLQRNLTIGSAPNRKLPRIPSTSEVNSNSQVKFRSSEAKLSSPFATVPTPKFNLTRSFSTPKVVRSLTTPKINLSRSSTTSGPPKSKLPRLSSVTRTYSTESKPLPVPTRLNCLQSLNLSTGELKMDSQDRESIYSFDSVSTNGRLLDRLGLDTESVDENQPDVDDDVFDPNKRNSVASIQFTGRLLDRLGLDDRQFTNRDSQLPPLPRQQPAPISLRSNSINQQRYPASQFLNNSQQKIFLGNVINKNKQIGPTGGIRIQNINKPINLMNDSSSPRRTNSIKSVQADIAFDSSSESGSSAQSMASASSISELPELDRLKSNQSTIQETPLTPKQFRVKESNVHQVSSSTAEYTLANDDAASQYANVLDDDDASSYVEDDNDDKLYTKSVHTEKNYYQDLDEFDFNSSNDSINESSRPSTVQSPQVKPSPMRSVSDSSTPKDFMAHQRNTSNSSIPGFLTNSPSSRRVISDSKVTDSPASAYSSSESGFPSPSPQSSDLSAESRTKLAIQLRSMGNHREASYQLQICANFPHNYPKAMFLYGMALRYGQGVKKNDRQSIKWLAKAILASNMTSANLNNYVSKINELQPEDLIFLVNKATNEDYDPTKFFDYYTSLPEAQQAKILHVKHANIVLNAYHELGNAMINGWGLTKSDELMGINFLSKAGSAGHVESMVQLGEIWCSKSKHHKKDLFQAAAWLRLSELFGAKSIGNSWIYKEKYMPKKPKK